MSSLSTTSDGVLRIQYFNAARQRKSIRLGPAEKFTPERAQRWREFIDELNEAAGDERLWSPPLARWVKKIGPALYAKLAEADLVPQRKRVGDAGQLGPFLDSYIDGRDDIKPSRRYKLTDARNKLVDCFGARRRLASVLPRDAKSFRSWLGTPRPVVSRKTGKPVVDLATGEPRLKALQENSIRGILRMAKQFFNAAVEQRIIFESPFAGIKKTGDLANRDRDEFVSQAITEKVVAACPDNQWKLVTVLCRYGGLRCPSEVFALRWGDVNWERNRINVRSPKTEHHDGKASRLLPLFAEVPPYLQAVYNELPEEKFQRLSAEPIVTVCRRRAGRANLRTQFQRIIKRAGVKPWPKPFVNLRTTRATKLRESYPDHVVNEWLGHTQKVAAKHYLQIREEHFDKASGANGAAPPPVHQSEKLPVAGGDDSLPSSKNPGKSNDSSGSEMGSTPRIGRLSNFFEGARRDSEVGSNREQAGYEVRILFATRRPKRTSSNSYCPTPRGAALARAKQRARRERGYKCAAPVASPRPPVQRHPYDWLKPRLGRPAGVVAGL